MMGGWFSGFVQKQRWHLVGALALLAIAVLSMCLGALWPGAAAAQTQEGWSKPVLLSTNTYLPWFPDIAADGEGRVHVVYDTRDVPIGEEAVVSGVMYTVYQDGVWSTPNDLIVGDTGDTFRAAIDTDYSGNIHMSCAAIQHRKAPVSAAVSASAWSHHVIDEGVTYMSALAIDSKETIHLVYEKWVLPEGTRATSEVHRTGLTDIFYQRSTDGGITWTAPINLSRLTEVGSYRVQIKVDAQDTLHVSWDEGWDWQSLEGEPREGAYRFSQDGGETWSPQITFFYPEGTNAQITIGSDDRGGVLAVWRATSQNELFYTWSEDGGISWSPPKVIPGIFARAYDDTFFDAYEMETDSASNIHLVAVGRSRPPESSVDVVPLGVYHLMWDGTSWLGPETLAVYLPNRGYPEYPRLDIGEGNRLHAVWFTRDEQLGGRDRRVWYSSAQTNAPYQTPVPTQTPTLAPLPTSTPIPLPTATPLPIPKVSSADPPEGLYTESKAIRLAMAISPVFILVIVIAIFKLGGLRRLFP
jgi:hypothetical protein